MFVFIIAALNFTVYHCDREKSHHKPIGEVSASIADGRQNLSAASAKGMGKRSLDTEAQAAYTTRKACRDLNTQVAKEALRNCNCYIPFLRVIIIFSVL